MATLKSLENKSISDMAEEELISHIMAIRSSRRTKKKATTTKKKAPPKARSTGDLINMLSPSQAEALLGKLKKEELDNG